MNLSSDLVIAFCVLFFVFCSLLFVELRQKVCVQFHYRQTDQAKDSTPDSRNQSISFYRAFSYKSGLSILVTRESASNKVLHTLSIEYLSYQPGNCPQRYKGTSAIMALLYDPLDPSVASDETTLSFLTIKEHARNKVLKGIQEIETRKKYLRSRFGPSCSKSRKGVQKLNEMVCNLLINRH